MAKAKLVAGKAGNLGAALKAASAVAQYTALEKAEAGKIIKAGKAADTAQGFFFRVIGEALLAGATTAGMEAAAPELKKNSSYRAYKAVYLGAKELAISWTDATGKLKGRAALAAEIKAAKTADNDGDEGEGDEGPVEQVTPQVPAAPVAPTKAETEKSIADALKLLDGSAELRDKFAEQLIALVGKIQKDIERAEAAAKKPKTA